MTSGTQLKQTPLADFHRERGAKLVDFAGWEMPLHYGSIRDEHRKVRTSGGIFDVSHMGRLEVRGRDATKFLDRVCTRQIHGMQDGQARYSIVCNADGGCRDDILVYRLAESEYLVVCNASNREKIIDHFDREKGDLVFRCEDTTERTAMIAVQGPRVMELIGKYSSEIPNLKRYRFVKKSILGLELLVSRTGYTGEDGVEVIFPTDGMVARTAMKMVMKDLASFEDVLVPAGLGARDSLRLEAAMALYGQEITEDIDPLSAGLDFAIKVDKADDDPAIGTFIGQEALREIAARGPARKLVGLVLDSPRAARQGMPVRAAETDIGVVTSGCLSPTLEKSIAMAYVDVGSADEGCEVGVDLGRATVAATIVKLPFYKS